jgi:hypothetical protein
VADSPAIAPTLTKNTRTVPGAMLWTLNDITAIETSIPDVTLASLLGKAAISSTSQCRLGVNVAVIVVGVRE